MKRCSKCRAAIATGKEVVLAGRVYHTNCVPGFKEERVRVSCPTSTVTARLPSKDPLERACDLLEQARGPLHSVAPGLAEDVLDFLAPSPTSLKPKSPDRLARVRALLWEATAKAHAHPTEAWRLVSEALGLCKVKE